MMEVSIVIAIIAIILAAALMALNPAQRIAEGRDNRREMDIQFIYQRIEESIHYYRGSLPVEIPSNFQEICNTPYAQSCEGFIDLSEILTENIPRDPIRKVADNGTGYEIAMINSKIAIKATSAETRIIKIGPDS